MKKVKIINKNMITDSYVSVIIFLFIILNFIILNFIILNSIIYGCSIISPVSSSNRI